MARHLRPSLLLAPGVVAILAMAGCPAPGTDKTGETGDSSPWIDTYVAPVDADGDGVTVEDGDCDDADASVFVGQVEECDGIDNNCNDLIDEGMPDADGDGTADCEDEEDCDGVDNNGDGVVDEGYPDSDGDGHADCVSEELCDGYDNNGDGNIDEDFDADGDGYTACSTPADCDDSNASVNPGEAETDGNGVDDDCDGVIDAATWAEGDLLITEVLYNPQAVIDPYGEFIELYNPTDSAVLVNGLEFVSSDGESFVVMSHEALSVPPGGYFLLASNGDESLNGGYVPDYVYSGFTLDNAGDDIGVYGAGVALSYFYWDGGTNVAEALGASLSVDPAYYGTSDTNYWCVSVNEWGSDPAGDKGSPGYLNEPCATWDHDGDGYTGLDGDCDDTNDTVYPGAFEGDPTLDNDCDGYVESAPVAVASVDSSGYACDTLTLDGTASYDPDTSGTISYRWELVGAPSGSAKTTADIDTTTSATPTFYPDETGTYTFQLTVNDGGTNSLPVTTSVTLGVRPGNNAPVADAGADQTVTGTTDCTPISYGAGGYDCDECASTSASLDASGSSDPDGDEFSYAWSITSGSSYGSLSSTTAATTSLTVSGVTGSYGTPATQDIVVRVTVTDCMGAEAYDEVTVQMQCTGS